MERKVSRPPVTLNLTVSDAVQAILVACMAESPLYGNSCPTILDSTTKAADYIVMNWWRGMGSPIGHP